MEKLRNHRGLYPSYLANDELSYQTQAGKRALENWFVTSNIKKIYAILMLPSINLDKLNSVFKRL